MTIQNYRKSLLAASCLAGLLATPAFAQEPPEPGDTVIVTGRTYNELATSSATKNDAPQLETPQSAQVITKQGYMRKITNGRGSTRLS